MSPYCFRLKYPALQGLSQAQLRSPKTTQGPAVAQHTDRGDRKRGGWASGLSPPRCPSILSQRGGGRGALGGGAPSFSAPCSRGAWPAACASAQNLLRNTPAGCSPHTGLPASSFPLLSVSSRTHAPDVPPGPDAPGSLWPQPEGQDALRTSGKEPKHFTLSVQESAQDG